MELEQRPAQWLQLCQGEANFVGKGCWRLPPARPLSLSLEPSCPSPLSTERNWSCSSGKAQRPESKAAAAAELSLFLFLRKRDCCCCTCQSSPAPRSTKRNVASNALGNSLAPRLRPRKARVQSLRRRSTGRNVLSQFATIELLPLLQQLDFSCFFIAIRNFAASRCPWRPLIVCLSLLRRSEATKS